MQIQLTLNSASLILLRCARPYEIPNDATTQAGSTVIFATRETSGWLLGTKRERHCASTSEEFACWRFARTAAYLECLQVMACTARSRDSEGWAKPALSSASWPLRSTADCSATGTFFDSSDNEADRVVPHEAL